MIILYSYRVILSIMAIYIIIMDYLRYIIRIQYQKHMLLLETFVQDG